MKFNQVEIGQTFVIPARPDKVWQKTAQVSTNGAHYCILVGGQPLVIGGQSITRATFERQRIVQGIEMKITTEAVAKYIEDRAKRNDDRGDMHQSCAYKLGVALSTIELALNHPECMKDLRSELAKVQANMGATK